jgi:hypothetical protein
MKTITHIPNVALLMVILITSGCSLMPAFADKSICRSETFQEVYSPNNEYKVVVYQRACGATTGFRTHISVLKSSAELGNQMGNVFQAEGYPDWFFIIVRWDDNHHITIESNGKSIPDFAKNEIDNIEVRYKENTEGIIASRSFTPSDLLLPVSHFPTGWSGEELRPFGSEEIKGSKENNPYMLYKPPLPAKYPEAMYYVTRFDNVDKAIDEFQREKEAAKENFSANCEPPIISSSNQLLFQSEYSINYFVGFGEHQDSSDKPGCKLIAQYDEFFIEFNATITESGLTYEQFNDLVKIIDQIMVEHLKQ